MPLMHVHRIPRLDNLLGSEGTRILCDALVHPEGPKQLTELHLACKAVRLVYLSITHQYVGNEIGDEGADHLLQALAHPGCSLARLQFYGNNEAPTPRLPTLDLHHRKQSL